MTYYAALDVSLRSVAICIVDDRGEICLEKSVNAEVEDIVHCLARFDQPIASVGLEAGTLTQHLTYGLKSRGLYGSPASQERAVCHARNPCRCLPPPSTCSRRRHCTSGDRRPGQSPACRSSRCSLRATPFQKQYPNGATDWSQK